jgi:hypothetical protein
MMTSAPTRRTRIFILGLRRSGTTIFWESFRRDPRLRCYNEPWNPVLRELPVEIPNRSRREVIELFRRDPATFWRRFAPIELIEELQSDLSERQVAYLRSLIDAFDGVCIDETRCHFKLAALREIEPDATIVHLFRTPAAFATSHLIPTGSGGFRTRRLVQTAARLGFFTRRDRFHWWGLQQLIGSHPESLFGLRLREFGMDPEDVYPLSAAGRLLAFWRLHYEVMERDGPRLFGPRFLSVPFERFCQSPKAVVEQVYAAAGLEPPALDLSRVKPAATAYRPSDRRWQELFARVGLPPAWLPGAGLPGETHPGVTRG